MAEGPLSVLLSRAWIAHAIEVDNTVEAAGARRLGRLFRISLAMWANALRFIDDDGIAIGELRARAGCNANLAGLERWGWIGLGEQTAARRAGYGTGRGLTEETVVRPTRAGAYARRLFAQAIGIVEERWQERFGEAAIAALGIALEPLTERMPWSPPEVHPSDGFLTHVRTRATNEPGRPLVARLGQALTAASVAWERDATASLPVAANLLRPIGTDAVPIRELPARSGVSKEAIAMGTGFLARNGLATLESGRAIRLTASGLDALRAWSEQHSAPSDARVALDAVLRNTEALSAGLHPPSGCWRNERPYLAQTRRLVADPTGALPWQPMVLHRGGWPDGS